MIIDHIIEAFSPCRWLSRSDVAALSDSARYLASRRARSSDWLLRSDSS
jgi:hypothetical protein